VAEFGAVSGGVDVFQPDRELPAPSLTAVNTTISGNTANSSGGGIGAFDGSVSLSSVTITANVADNNADGGGDGGGVFVDDITDDGRGGQLTFANTIIAGNQDRSAAQSYPDCSGRLLSESYNLTGSEAGCFVEGVRLGDVSGAPVLGPLQDNGGGVPTHAPLAASLAIEGGDPTTPGGTCPAVDQRGVARPVDSDGDGAARCEIGAVETVPTSLSLGASGSPVAAAPGTSVTYSAEVRNAGPNSAPSVTVQLALPPGAGYAGASGDGWSCGLLGGTVTCSYAGLSAGSSTPVVDITLIAPEFSGELHAALQLSSTALDSDSADNTVTVVTLRGAGVFLPVAVRIAD
jgi:uncharacterized repeat protein (TIGR01451 family)